MPGAEYQSILQSPSPSSNTAVIIARSTRHDDDDDLYRERCPNISQILCNNIAKSCGRRTIYKRLPITDWMPKYKTNILVEDFVAGLTVALTAVPQGIAYAVVAGLPPQYGLYSAFMGCFVYFVFGSCKDITIGPTAITALLIQAAVMKLNIDFAILATFLSGIVILFCGILNLGFVVQFISAPVVAAFTTAAATTIASGQIKPLLGITSGKSNEFVAAWENVILHIDETKLWDTLLGIFSIILLFGLKNLNQINNSWKPVFKYVSISRNAIIVIGGTLTAYLLHVNGMDPFRLTGSVTAGLPPFKLPPFSTKFNDRTYEFWDMVKALGTSCITIPLISILESIAIAKAFSKGKIIDATQEMIALGLCNLLGAFVSSIPVTGSFTRSAVNHASGVRTPFGGVFTGALVLIALGLLTKTFFFIPKATLAAVIIAAMFSMIEVHAVKEIWRTRKMDIIPFLATLLGCLLLGLEYGILIGVGINVLFVLYSTSRPNIEFIEEKLGDQDLLLVKPNQSLIYSSAEYFKAAVTKKATVTYPSSKIVVIDGSAIQHMDVTVMRNLSSIITDLHLVEKSVIFWNWNKEPMYLALRFDRSLKKHFRNCADLSDLHMQLKMDDNDESITITL